MCAAAKRAVHGDAPSDGEAATSRSSTPTATHATARGASAVEHVAARAQPRRTRSGCARRSPRAASRRSRWSVGPAPARPRCSKRPSGARLATPPRARRSSRATARPTTTRGASPRCGARAVQVATGALCHLDAHLVEHALEHLDLDGVARLWIENVGNLVCTARLPVRRARAASRCSRCPRATTSPRSTRRSSRPPTCWWSASPICCRTSRSTSSAASPPRRRVRPGLPHLVVSARSGAGMDALARLARGTGAD